MEPTWALVAAVAGAGLLLAGFGFSRGWDLGVAAMAREVNGKIDRNGAAWEERTRKAVNDGANRALRCGYRMGVEATLRAAAGDDPGKIMEFEGALTILRARWKEEDEAA